MAPLKAMRLTRRNLAIIAAVTVVLAAVFGVGWYLQFQVDRELARFSVDPTRLKYEKDLGEVAKIRAEIQQIRSDTAGSLFWLKMVALFVTVGGAVGGYLAGLRSTTRRRLRFERRRDIDAAYQGILTELAGDKELIRAAAAVKLGGILKDFPAVWKVGPERRQEMIDLTKRVLAASMSIETDPTVLKTIAAALVMHHPAAAAGAPASALADCRELDLSRAKATDVYWAKSDFTYADFYGAELSRASLRRSVLRGAQFREAILRDAVLAEADCSGTSFKLTDLTNADLSGARLDGASFEGARVHGAKLDRALLEKPLKNPAEEVVLAAPTGERETVSVAEWLRRHGVGI